MLQKLGTASIERRRNRERRKAERLNARSSEVSVAHDGGVDAAFCADVSRSGARLSLDRPLAVGETLTINFGPEVSLTGRVAWVDQAECGVIFEQEVGGALSAGMPGNRPAASADRRRTTLAMLHEEPGFRDGLNVTVVLPDCERKAVLRWTEDNFANLTIQA